MFVGRFECTSVSAATQTLLNVVIETGADVSRVNLVVGYGTWPQVAVVD